MAKPRKITLRLEEQTYQRLRRGAKDLDVSLSEYIRLLTLKSAETVNSHFLDFVAQRFAEHLVKDVEWWRRYWAAHPEHLLRVPGRAPGKEGKP